MFGRRIESADPATTRSRPIRGPKPPPPAPVGPKDGGHGVEGRGGWRTAAGLECLSHIAQGARQRDRCLLRRRSILQQERAEPLGVSEPDQGVESRRICIFFAIYTPESIHMHPKTIIQSQTGRRQIPTRRSCRVDLNTPRTLAAHVLFITLPLPDLTPRPPPPASQPPLKSPPPPVRPAPASGPTAPTPRAPGSAARTGSSTGRCAVPRGGPRPRGRF